MKLVVEDHDEIRQVVEQQTPVEVEGESSPLEFMKLVVPAAATLVYPVFLQIALMGLAVYGVGVILHTTVKIVERYLARSQPSLIDQIVARLEGGGNEKFIQSFLESAASLRQIEEKKEEDSDV